MIRGTLRHRRETWARQRRRPGWWVTAALTTVLLLSGLPARAASPCDSPTVIPEGYEHLRADCEALWAFRTHLDNPGVLDDPDNPRAWLPTTPFLRWQGVVIGDDGVEALILPDAGLRGPVSPALGELDRLETLVLHDNRLTGPIPRELAFWKDRYRQS